ncbi:antibiotic biosynthesis monooxygenase (plasmid) [Streptomyces sp. CG1]|uniref:antibiotic biosynthesis monooxygenase family protein n=1 Tax=Streptomyces sp. CG1 TaxID=1287523 RepID=UPI0034E2CA98
MTHISISPENGYYTTINIFRTTPENQRALADTLAGADGMLREHPGFVGAAVHVSHDGATVVSYVQWEKEDAFHAMRQHPEAQGHFHTVKDLVSSVDSIACSVTYTHDKS